MDKMKNRRESTVWEQWSKIFDYLFYPLFFGKKKDKFDYGLYEPLSSDKRSSKGLF